MSCDEVEERPWGSFRIIEEGAGYKVKIITVKPGCRLSYQSHESRRERWIFIEGRGEVTIDGNIIPSGPGDVLKIEMRAKHRLANTGENLLRIVEVQMGSYLGEDDIVRYEDDFGRADGR